MEPREIEFLCRIFGLTCSELAQTLCLASITVERWERGRNKPTGLALAVLRALYQAAEEVDRCADTARARSIRALLVPGIGTLLSSLLREQRPQSERTRTVARVPIVVDLLEAGAVPRYQRIAEDARRMHALGMNMAEIARALGTDGHLARKAVRWALGPDAAEEPLRQPARYKQVAEEALSLKEAGWSLRRIGRRLGLSAPMVMRALTWARSRRS